MRVLERIGEAVDRKVGGQEKQGLSPAEMATLESLLERAIEDGIVNDSSRGLKVAPNELTVSLTYETASALGKDYLSALEEELRACALEFINNRRYSVSGEIRVRITADVLAKSPSVNASLSASASPGGKPSLSSSAQPARMLLELTGRAGNYSTELVASSPPATIGRTSGCAIFVDDPSVSRLHASVALTADYEVVLSDLGSANGTSVNGEIVNTGEARKVFAGDVITVGDVELTFAGLCPVE